MVVWCATVRNVYVWRPNSSENLINFLKATCWKNRRISKIIINRPQQVSKVTASKLCHTVQRTVSRRWKSRFKIMN